MTFEQWLEQVMIECAAISAKPPLEPFQKVWFSSGLTPVQVAQLLKEKQS